MSDTSARAPEAASLATAASRIELVEASGPVSPRHSYATTIVITCDATPGVIARAVRDHRDANGEHHHERALDRAAYDALLGDLVAVLPLGAPIDLAASKRDRKGISFNHVVVVVGDAATRLDYLLSDLDEDHGDPRARSAVALVKGAASGD
jgi:hypothetical protein